MIPRLAPGFFGGSGPQFTAIATSSGTNPLFAYAWDDTTQTPGAAFAAPATASAGVSQGPMSFRTGGAALVKGAAATTMVEAYAWNSGGGWGAKFAAPVGGPTFSGGSGAGAMFTPDGAHVLLKIDGFGNTNDTFLWQWNSGSGFGALVTAFNINDRVPWVAFRPQGDVVVLGRSVYAYSPGAFGATYTLPAVGFGMKFNRDGDKLIGGAPSNSGALVMTWSGGASNPQTSGAYGATQTGSDNFMRSAATPVEGLAGSFIALSTYTTGNPGVVQLVPYNPTTNVFGSPVASYGFASSDYWWQGFVPHPARPLFLATYVPNLAASVDSFTNFRATSSSLTLVGATAAPNPDNDPVGMSAWRGKTY